MIDPRIVSDLYWNENLSQKKIAKRLGVSYGQVLTTIRKYKIPMRSKTEAQAISTKGIPRSEEVRNLISERTKEAMKKVPREKLQYWKGKTQSEETKQLWSKQRMGHPYYGGGPPKGCVFSEEHKQNMSLNHADISGHKNPNWFGGVSKLPYAFSFDEELKELVKNRDGYRCQFPDCGTDEDLVVHHADYDKMNSNPKNLITLCRSHNAKVNFNREHWTEYFKEMT